MFLEEGGGVWGGQRFCPLFMTARCKDSLCLYSLMVWLHEQRQRGERKQPPPHTISGPTVWFLIKVLQSCVAVVGVTDELMFRSFSLSLLESTPLTHCCTFTTYFWRNLLCPLLHRTGAEINPYNQTGVLFYIWPCILFIPVWTQTQTQTHSKLQTLHLKSTPRRGISSITNHITVVS